MLIAGKKLMEQSIQRTRLETLAPRQVWGMTAYNVLSEHQDRRYSAADLAREAEARLAIIEQIRKEQGYE